MAKRVRLKPAHHWYCPECKALNFCKCVRVEMTQEDIRHMVNEYGGEPKDYATGELVSQPDEVTCRKCKREFETKDIGPRAPGDEEGQ